MSDPDVSKSDNLPGPPQQTMVRGIPVRVLIPNLITLMVAAAGMTAIRFAVEGRLTHAVMAIAAAALLDGLDGRIARMLKGASRFGAELDSLADFLSFGCAPALLLYFWSLHELSTIGWLASVSLAFASALRLARFNVSTEDTTKPEWTKAFFTGVPAPAGALLALLPINLYLSGVPSFPGHSALVAIFTVMVGALMVSRLPTLSGKGKSGPIPREKVIPIVAAVLAVVLLLVNHPFPTISAITIGYLALLPYGVSRYRALSAAHEREKTAA